MKRCLSIFALALFVALGHASSGVVLPAYAEGNSGDGGGSGGSDGGGNTGGGNDGGGTGPDGGGTYGHDPRDKEIPRGQSGHRTKPKRTIISLF